MNVIGSVRYKNRTELPEKKSKFCDRVQEIIIKHHAPIDYILNDDGFSGIIELTILNQDLNQDIRNELLRALEEEINS